jgi:2-polyprenyl-6-methoxyphenol hydroxylase-like FAD-dependent oxidoreductase
MSLLHSRPNGVITVRVLIAGAGIAGLTAALSLHAAGIDTLVVDPVSELKPLGVGINLLPHAVRELTELGLGEQLAATGIETAEQAHFDRHGGFIWSEPRGRGLGYTWPQYSIHRGELQMLLLAAVRERLGHDAVRTSTAVTGFTEHDSSVAVRLSPRPNGPTHLHTADLLLGADGLYSSVRQLLHPEDPPPRWSGVMMWRGTAEGAPFLSGTSLAITGSTTSAKFVSYPIARTGRGTVVINWVAEVMIGGDEPPIRPDWTREGRLAEVLPYFADWKFDWLDIPDLMTRSAEILQYAMVDRDPLTSWGRGRVTLAGDAAHPVYPLGSNGGSQAIVDARVLARELSVAGTPEDAVAAYEAARVPATAEIVLATRHMPVDRVVDMVHDRAPDGFAHIEDVLTESELASLRDAYRATSLQDVTALNTRPPLLSPAAPIPCRHRPTRPTQPLLAVIRDGGTLVARSRRRGGVGVAYLCGRIGRCQTQPRSCQNPRMAASSRAAARSGPRTPPRWGAFASTG